MASEATLAPDDSEHYLTWFGHSALRLESKGKCILLDPMLGDWVAPIPFLGHRFPYAKSPANQQFSQIDLVLYSHDHYDHLDRTTVLRIDQKVKRYLVPMGVGIHLRAWGIDESKIMEIDWWETISIDEIDYTFAPARHFSGRSPGQRNKSLWGSYAIRLDGSTNIFFGGDSGYGKHFKMIGERLGPFDLTMLDCGQYHKRWKNVHMHPEEAIIAHRDLKGGQLLPIHWGGFSLSNHPWSEPAIRILSADEDKCVVTPKIGERFKIGDRQFCGSTWWDQLLQKKLDNPASKHV
jgi:L-ascorbate metabolism protein UlaG (beta-lactamase superfamily)